MAVFLEIVAVLILVCVGAAFFRKREGKYEREFGMIAYPSKPKRNESTPKLALPRRDGSTEAMPSGHELVDIDDTLPRDAREQLVEFLLALIDIGRYSLYLDNLRPTATVGLMTPSIWRTVTPVLRRNGLKIGSSLDPDLPHYADLVTDLVNDEAFFWLCVRLTPELVATVELCDILTDSEGYPIREDILPVSSTINTLTRLHGFFYPSRRKPDPSM